MKREIFTDRIALRPLQLSDAAFILELFNSPSWIEFIGDRGIKTITAAEDFLSQNAIRSFKENGWGTYIIEDIQTREPMGTVGLYVREHLDSPDFGYALLPAFEGMGIATAASIALLKEIDTALKFSPLLAIVQSNNLRSLRVLEKLGFVYKKDVELNGEMIQLHQRGA